jgi:hypothetical protein
MHRTPGKRFYEIQHITKKEFATKARERTMKKKKWFNGLTAALDLIVLSGCGTPAAAYYVQGVAYCDKRARRFISPPPHG